MKQQKDDIVYRLIGLLILVWFIMVMVIAFVG
jgi:hypothetical protein